jgi:hypothetical protein
MKSELAADHQSSDFTEKQATSYGLTGWVKNTDDGKVCHDQH